MREIITGTPLFGITLTLVAWQIGAWLNKKTKLALFNPLMIAVLIIAAVLLIFDIPFSVYNEGAAFINMFMAPITCLLAVSIWRQRKLVKEHFLSILMGTLVGSLTSIVFIFLMANMFGLDDTLKFSLLSKSVTTPIALAITESLGGIGAITVASLILTGILGNMLAPIMIRIFRIKTRIAGGVAIGTSSHVIGTSRALEMGEDMGALSGIALSFSGIITAVACLLIF